jgi:hypothetical protein
VIWSLQLGLAAVLVVFVGRALATNWSEFRALDVDISLRARPLVLAVLTTLLTYGCLIEAWRRVILGWGDRLSFHDAAYIWTVSNLGRYIPGKVWTLAGLVVLARREGVRGATATAGGLVMQVVAVGTGGAVMVAGLAGETALWGALAAVALSAAVVTGLVWQPVGVPIMRMLGGGAEARPLAPGPALLAVGATLVGWVTHGLSFWLISRGVLADASLALSAAITAFAGAYILGLLALFAPGGLGVREAVLATALAPITGAGGAVLLSIASRLFLTVMEIGVALVAVGSKALTKERDSV